MKLKTLTIHNIASIEDATIDFAGSELANQDIFLISGPTGSGKTTILDAICLALFNTTPRIQHSENDSIDFNTVDNDKNKATLKNPLHLVRKNAPDAHVILTFEGVDGKECTAIWEVKRKIRKSKNNVDRDRYEQESLEEKLQREVEKNWSITDGDGVCHETYVPNVIESLIGMNFDQFCKTTMLAQGDFTRFLSSKSDDKADILEKLVGTELYSAVGKQINDTYNDKRREVAAIQEQLESALFLSDEEIAERKQRIETLTAELAQLKEARSLTDNKLKWVSDKQKADTGIEVAAKSLQCAEDALAADDVKADKELTELWFKTADVRSALKMQSDCITESKKNDDQKELLENKFVTATAGLNALSGKINARQSEIQVETDNINRQKPFESMYANASVFCKAHEEVVAAKKFIADNEPKLSAFDAEINTLQAKVESNQQAVKDAEKEIADLEKQQTGLQQDLQKQGADTIDKEVKRLNEHKLLVSNAENASKAYQEAVATRKAKGEELANAIEKFDNLHQVAIKAASELATVEEAYNKSKATYEKYKASIEDHAKVLRAELKVGDHCPVCGKLVEELIGDEIFENALKVLEEAYRKDEAVYNNQTKETARAKAEEEVAKEAISSIKKEHENLEAKVATVHKNWSEVCKKLDISDCDNQEAKLAALKEVDKEAEATLEVRQQTIKAIRQQIDALTKSIADVRNKKLTVATAAVETVNKQILSKQLEKQQLATKIEASKNTAGTKQSEIDSAINPDWKPAVEANYFDELKAAAAAFDKAKKDLLQKQNELALYENDRSLISDCKEKILGIFADWGQFESTDAREVSNLGSVWTNLLSETNALASKIANVASNKQNAEGAIAEFFNQHTDINIEAVKVAMNHTAVEVNQKQNRVAKLNEALVKAKTELASANKILAELPVNPLAEGDTVESLTEMQNQIGVGEQEKNREIGSIRAELKADEESRQSHGKKKEELDKLKAELAEWKTLDDFLGSTDGKKFRNVAQSFILGDLLDKANAYLENITGRYTLFCNPGTLTIMMRDAYQGGVVRPTNTLSGGESFIISLSLALGLSSMKSGGFQVDTLFIDEGFGTLSPEYLDPVITALKRLYETYGRRVGIISHVDSLKARIPVSIAVSREGNSSSKVEIVMN